MAARLGATLPLLIALLQLARSQDASSIFFGPVERSYAQVQPQLFNTRQQAYYDHQDFPSHQKYSVPNQASLPSPNYNQNPSPFQLPTGRSQPPGQFFLNQADFASAQKPSSRFRLATPQNFHYTLPSTYRPDTSHIHSLAYQHDPSRPETFLGQITINNPDTDFLPSNRFKNPQFGLTASGVKINSPGDDTVISNEDLFSDHRVTTYNPARLNANKKQKTTVRHNKPKSEESYNYDSNYDDNDEVKSEIVSQNNDHTLKNVRNQYNVKDNPNKKQYVRPSNTEHKNAYDLTPLLEDEIEDAPMKVFKPIPIDYVNKKVLKSNNQFEEVPSLDNDKYDNNPSASSMNTGNVSKDTESYDPHTTTTFITTTTIIKEENHNEEIKDYDSDDEERHEKTTPSINKVSQTVQSEEKHFTHEPPTTNSKEKNTEDVYYEYDDYEQGEPVSSKVHSDNPDEDYIEDSNTDDRRYEDATQSSDEKISSEVSQIQAENPTTKSFEVVTLKPNNTMVKDDNFKGFVDTTSMDHAYSEELPEDHTQPTTTTTVDTSSILRQEVVSVVTTKSVINGTISVPDVTLAPSTKKLETNSDKRSNHSQGSTTQHTKQYSHSTQPTTTENWVIASVQTSRSVSGARFLPFPAVEQEEKKQVLTEDSSSDGDFTVTEDPGTMADKLLNSTSTESINDKLDSIQSELSSSVLSGSYKNNDSNFAVITEASTENDTTTTSPTPLQLFTVRTITTPPTTEKSAPDPLPVTIKKFGSHLRPPTSSTTEKPKRKTNYLTTKVDDLSGFLPPGYKPRVSYKDRKKTTTSPTSTTPITTARTTLPSDNTLNETQGRSSGITNKNSVLIKDPSTSVPSKTFTPSKEKPSQLEDLFANFKSEDISKFLPPGFKLNATTTTEAPKKPELKIESILNVSPVDVSSFLPKDYTTASSVTTKKPKHKFTTIADKVDISAFLPKGFKLDQAKDSEKEIKKVQLTDLSNLLPPGYNASKAQTEEKVEIKNDASTATYASSSTTSKPSPSSGFKVVFPSRPGSNKPARKNATSKPIGGVGPVTLVPTIQKGWPTRASTEFTGWPTPSTTPFSIDKLLEAQRNATATSAPPPLSTAPPAPPTRRTTTTTTQPPPPSTTPGVCWHQCDVAATIKIVKGVDWVPELLDHHTEEWKKLAEDVRTELNSVYSKSDKLKKWYKGIRIDAFSKGSVLVDYFVELHDISEKIDTLELKQMFHQSLDSARPGSVTETPFDPDAMLGDQPEEDREKTVDKSAGKLEIGKFVVDPAYTEFIVRPKAPEPAVSKAEEDAFLPQWGIAVIVIALASLLFVIIFGVTVLVNRHKSAKAKQPIPLSEDILRELDKNHMGGYDDMHLKERELPYPPSKQRRLSATLAEPPGYPGAAGDSWRSEWTPQLQQYLQHTPDSGRGSQLYGHQYGYGGGSQLYGQTGAGSLYGYTGDYPPHPRSLYSRRRSEYDANF